MNINKLNYKKVLAVAHDAGGAEILSSFIRQKKLECTFILSGPAIKIFNRKLKNILNLKNINNIKKNNKVDIILTGTSSHAKCEFDVIEYSKRKNIYCVSFLDHWVNYRKRFIRKKKYILPNEIIAGDKLSYKIAKNEFKNKVQISYYRNSYFDEVKIKNYKKKNDKKSIIFLSSNMDSVKNFIAKDKEIFLNSINSISEFLIKKKINKIIIRKHPSENIKKYQNIKFDNIKNFKVIFDNEEDICETLKQSQYVIGYDSMGLVIAKFMKKFKIKKLRNTIPFKYINKHV